MPTTPLGVWTPGDTDEWDLTVDLAAMANSVDDAITDVVGPVEAGQTSLSNQVKLSVATVGALPASGNWQGRQVMVTGSKLIYQWNGTAWVGQPGGSVYLTRNAAQAIPVTTPTTVVFTGGTTVKAGPDIFTVNLGAGTITVGAAGVYRITGGGTYSLTPNGYRLTGIYVNGSRIKTDYVVTAAIYTSNVTHVMQLNVGDVVNLNAQVSGGANTLWVSGGEYLTSLSVERLG